MLSALEDRQIPVNQLSGWRFNERPDDQDDESYFTPLLSRRLSRRTVSRTCRKRQVCGMFALQSSNKRFDSVASSGRLVIYDLAHRLKIHLPHNKPACRRVAQCAKVGVWDTRREQTLAWCRRIAARGEYFIVGRTPPVEAIERREQTQILAERAKHRYGLLWAHACPRPLLHPKPSLPSFD